MSARAAKSHERGQVRLIAGGTARGWKGPDIKAEMNQALTIEEARTLAADLTKLADAAEAKVMAETARAERRRKWQEREIAAGRMRVMSVGDFFGRGKP